MSEEVNDTEEQMILRFIKWSEVNCIPIHEHSYEEIEEFIMRFLKAAG